MPLKLKDSGAWKQLRRGNISLNVAGNVKKAQQVWLKSDSIWVPMFELFATARWGYASFAGPALNEGGHLGPQQFIDALGTNMENNEDGNTFTYDLPDSSTYAYFAHPKSMGIAVFTDEGNGFPGAWDGAKWLADLSNYNTESGPTEVTYNPGTGDEQWYVYRTDWAGPNFSPVTFRVDYPSRPANA